MSRTREADGFKTVMLIGNVIIVGLAFAAGVMVGGNISRPECREADGASEDGKGGIVAPELTFPEVLESRDAGAATLPEPRQEPAEPPAVADAGAPALPPARGPWCLQVAAYREDEPARQLAKKLKGLGLEPIRLLESQVPGKGRYVRVRVGAWPSKESARRAQKRLAVEQALDSLLMKCREP